MSLSALQIYYWPSSSRMLRERFLVWQERGTKQRADYAQTMREPKIAQVSGCLPGYPGGHSLSYTNATYPCPSTSEMDPNGVSHLFWNDPF